MAKAPSSGETKAWNSRTFSAGFVVKLLLMAFVNALGVFILFTSFTKGSWFVFGGMLVLLVAADYVYFTNKRTLPAKYILPGVIFLLVFQVFAVCFNVYIAFTNYGSGHMTSSANEAAALIMGQNEKRVPDSPSFPSVVIRDGDELGLAIIRDGAVWAGDNDRPLTRVDSAQLDGNRITAVPGWEIVTQLGPIQQQLTAVRVAVPDMPGVSVRTQMGSSSFLATTVMKWDPSAQTITNTENGAVYRATADGFFRTDAGERFTTGWQVNVGFDNFVRAFFSGSDYGKYFLGALIWTVAFSLLSVILTFLLGTVLAIVLNEERVRGRKIYRSLLLLPYAFPAFLGALVWRNLMDTDGFFNTVFLGGAHINWLYTPTEGGFWLARASVLLVQLWLGFPYMFLISTGALQSLPADIKEAAAVDGAGPIRTWISVTGPLLLISTAPVLIASFAFNFNNFTLIYMLTHGGPSYSPTSPMGATDILISMVYKISGVDGRSAAADYGLASALSIVIFIVVGVVSALGFRQTRKLEEMV